MAPTRSTRTRLLLRAAALGAAALGAACLPAAPSAADSARAVPSPAQDEQPGPAASEVAVLAGGCFWGVQGVFEHVAGVTSATSGYTGGAAAAAHYEDVGTGATGHAESVRVTFDPAKISYGRILQVFFSVAHDPTTLNAQGPDRGTQYRSAVFPTSAEQERVAVAYIAQLDQAHVFDTAIVTRVEPGKTFYPAESYHQDFLANHPDYLYIVVNDLPKIEDLRRLLPDLWRREPVLTASR